MEPKQFWNSSYQSIYFEDELGNAISIAPKQRRLSGIFSTGGDLTLGFPDNYEEYHIYHYNDSNVTAADLDYMMQWRDAVRVSIFDKSDVPRKLSQRVHEMKQMQHLKQLEFNINPATRLNVRLLLEELLELESVVFYGIALTDEQFDAFIDDQDVEDLEAWEEFCLHDPKEIHYKRRG